MRRQRHEFKVDEKLRKQIEMIRNGEHLAENNIYEMT